jgi:hypothetical protein
MPFEYDGKILTSELAEVFNHFQTLIHLAE